MTTIEPPPSFQRDSVKVAAGFDVGAGVYRATSVDGEGRPRVVVEGQPLQVEGSVFATGVAQGIDYADRIATKLYLNEGTTANRFGVGTLTTTEGLVWKQGGPYPWPTATENLYVCSTNAGDVGQLVYFGNLLDAAFNELPPVVVALNGQNPVPIAAAYRCSTAWMMSGTIAGTVRAGYGAVAGGVPANTLVRIDPADNRSLQAVYTVPANKQLLIHRVDFAIDGAVDTDVSVLARMPTAGAPWWRLATYLQRRNTASVDFDSKVPVRLETGHDLQLVGVVSSGSTACSAYFTGLELIVPLVPPAP